MPQAPLLTVASYNIQKGIGADFRRRPDRILAVLDEIGADVVLLQEADRRFGLRHAVLPPEMLSAHDWRVVPLATRPTSIGWHGNAILVGPRIRIMESQRIELPVLEPRGAVMATLQLDGVPFRAVGMHLDLSGFWRRRQAQAILTQVNASKPALPLILMGDCNEWRGQAGCIADFAGDLHTVHAGPSYPAPRPMVALDRIFLSQPLRPDSAGVHRSLLARSASDHLPVWVKVRIPPV